MSLLRELQNEKFIYTLQVRGKPDQTVERLITRIKTPLTLRDKQKSTIKAIKSKNMELESEIEEMRKQIIQMET